MQFADVLCYIVLTITVTASCVRAEENKSEVEEPQAVKKISKREATVILDNFPMDRIFQKPKVIYRRISKSRYGPPKSKYGPPRPKIKPPKATKKPGKKGRKGKPKKGAIPKFGVHDYKAVNNLNKKRASKPKPKYGIPKTKPNGRPSFGHVVKMPHYSFFVPENGNFGEPPAPYVRDQPSQKHGYIDPLVDSYGAPVKPNPINEVYSTPQSFQETSPPYEAQEYNRPDYQWSNNKFVQQSDTDYAFSKNRPAFAKQPVFVTPHPKDYNDDTFDADAAEKHNVMQDNKFFFRRKRPFYFADSKVVNRPWKPNKQNEFEDDIIVGGQYAEPPARFLAKTQQSPMYDDDEDEDTFSPLHGYVDMDLPSSNNSPYVNYKHSNLAFSPQNLNDAFSIVDK
nr:uncharacterized protein LOC110374029 [Helicoverpa armigera]